MAVTTNILRSWRKPRTVIREMLQGPDREDMAFAYLMVACFIIFVGQWPRLSRQAAGFDLAPGAETPELSRLVAYEFVSWMLVWPLVMFLLAMLSRLCARLLGGQGTPYRARLALFWSLLASTPVLLLYGLVRGFIGPGAEANLVGVVWMIGFAYIWLSTLRETERAS